MKFSKRLIVTMAVLAAGNSPDFTSAENLRKHSDVTFTTPAGLTLNMDDLNFVQRHLEEKYPGAPTFTFDDLVDAVGKIEPVSYTGDDYHINRGKCLFLLQVIDAKLSELKMDDHFSFVDHYGPSICGTARPTSAPTTDKPTTDSPTLAPITITDSPSKAPTDERKLHISIIFYLLDSTVTYHLTYYTNIIQSDPSTYRRAIVTTVCRTIVSSDPSTVITAICRAIVSTDPSTVVTADYRAIIISDPSTVITTVGQSNIDTNFISILRTSW